MPRPATADIEALLRALELLEHSQEVSEAGLRVRVIDLDTLIAIKSSTGRARDKLVVPVLLAVKRGV